METIRFEDLELDAKIMRAITDMGFEAASPIQGQAIPLELQGLDIIGQAQTGTGKTAAFGIPLLQKIDPKNKKPQAIILCPTRELAIQVSEEIRRLAKYMHGVKVLPIYGGQEIGRQIRSLKDGVQVIIGTPGRVMDHMRRKTVKMDQIHTVVLDEADEMLNMGFLEDMETILSALPEERQTLMFSATMPQAIPSLDDVTSIKADKILDQVGEVLQDSDLSKVIDIVEKRVLEEDYTTLDLAAALLKMMMGEEGEELLEENRPLRELEDLEDESRRSRGGRNGRGSRGRNEDVARLFINIGKNQGIRPGDILGAIAGESGMPGRMVGSIDMFDNYTFVEVPREHADVVLQAMRGAKIKGKNVHMEKANRK